MTAINRFIQLVGNINEWTGRIAAYLVLPITLFAVMEVFLRYIFSSPTIWVWDTNIMLMGALIVLSGGYILHKGGHVSVDLLVLRLSTRPRAILSAVTYLVVFLAVGLLLWHSAIAVRDSLRTTELLGTNWNPPLAPLRIVWLIGVFFLLLQCIAKFFSDLIIAFSKGDES